MKHNGGFTIIELLVVTVVITLLIGTMLAPLSNQIETRKFSDTRKSLEEIKEALIGFAIINGRLPCPDTDDDPAAPGYGVENTGCSTAAPTAEGYLPWKTLGVSEMDAFGIRRTSSGSPRLGDWRYRVDRNFANPATLPNLLTSFADALIINDSAGHNLTTSESPIAIVFSVGPNGVPDGENAAFNNTYQSDVAGVNFDDVVMWVSRPLLFNRLVTSGKLP